MLDLLFNANKFIQAGITIAIIIAIAVIIIALIKWPNGRIFIFTGLFVILLASGIYSGIKINYYTQTTGGIYGELSGLFKPNEVKIVNSTTFDLNNIELTQVHDDLYRARANVNEIVNLPVGYSYAILVNGMPCDNLTSSNDYAISNYTYSFLDSDLQTLKTDTLSIRFAFYQNSTSLQVETTGGAEAVKYWNEYFNKNAFTITLTTDKYFEDNVLDFGDGDISNYVAIKYLIDDKTMLTFAKIGEKLKLIDSPKKDCYRFGGWSLNNETVFDFSNFVVSESITIYPIWNLTTLENYSWQEIKTIFHSGKVNDNKEFEFNGEVVFRVGDEKKATLTDNRIITVQIADFNVDSDADSNVLPCTFITKEVVGTHIMNSTGYPALVQTYSSGLKTAYTDVTFKDTELYSYLNNEIYNLLPNDLKDVITKAHKQYTAYNNAHVINYSDDNIFLFSERGQSSYSKYTLLKLNKNLMKYDLDGNLTRWWLSDNYSYNEEIDWFGSVQTENYTHFNYIDYYEGQARVNNYQGVTYAQGIVFGFCI